MPTSPASQRVAPGVSSRRTGAPCRKTKSSAAATGTGGALSAEPTTSSSAPAASGARLTSQNSRSGRGASAAKAGAPDSAMRTPTVPGAAHRASGMEGGGGGGMTRGLGAKGAGGAPSAGPTILRKTASASGKSALRQLLCDADKPIDTGLGPRSAWGDDRRPRPDDRQASSGQPMKLGDWICPECDQHNFARNVSCYRCDADKPSALDQDEGHAEMEYWTCPECNAHNLGTERACLRCDAAKPSQSQWVARSAAAETMKGTTQNTNRKARRQRAGNLTQQGEAEPTEDNTRQALLAEEQSADGSASDTEGSPSGKPGRQSPSQAEQDDVAEPKDVAAALPTLTEEQVRKSSVAELRELAEAQGALPKGRSAFKKADWIAHVLSLHGFGPE
ncbi:uncharacterized protein LOC142358137 [Convolutriloba macropyga]|uniref:uncharacterized protein LOC142358137 n=1 Tax=Convolutriloba macropyga TaxID=536237 RepID=UPI003F522609